MGRKKNKNNPRKTINDAQAGTGESDRLWGGRAREIYVPMYASHDADTGICTVRGYTIRAYQAGCLTVTTTTVHTKREKKRENLALLGKKKKKGGLDTDEKESFFHKRRRR